MKLTDRELAGGLKAGSVLGSDAKSVLTSGRHGMSGSTGVCMDTA